MRAIACGISMLGLLIPNPALAQSQPYVATITDSEVKLRAFASDKYPVTGTLPRGSIVVVDHEAEAGWLAVRPPAGSVSWIPTTFVTPIDESRPLPQNVVVNSEGSVTLAPGQVGLPQPLDAIRKVNVPNGTILTVIGPKVSYQGKTWYPVVPPDGDYRYLPRTSVQASSALRESFSVTGGSQSTPNTPTNPEATASPLGSGQTSSQPGGSSAASWRGSPQPHPLWVQAEQAENAGRLDDAERLFFELARKMNEPGGDHDLANQCYTRIHSLREKKRLNQSVSQGLSRLPAPSSPSHSTPSTIQTSRSEDKPPRSEVMGNSRLSPPTSTDPRPSRNPSPPELKASPPPRDASLATTAGERRSEANDSERWTGPGFLIRTGYSLDGKVTYALESSPRVVRYYVVESPGIDLKPFVNKRVDLFGSVSKRREISAPLVTASAVEPIE